MREKILLAENILKNKPGVLTKNRFTSDLNGCDIEITATHKNNLVSTYNVKHNNSYSNSKICIEFGKYGNNTRLKTGIAAMKGQYLLFTFNDDPNVYMIGRRKLLRMCDEPTPDSVKYTRTDSNDCLLALFDRETLLEKCFIL
jgi:hypothetical protein